MRIISFIAFFYFCLTNCYSQTTSCKPTITIEAGIFPSNTDSAFKCPIGRCCYTNIKSKAPDLEIVSFRLMALKVCSDPDDIIEIENHGSNFNNPVLNLLKRTCKGSVLYFDCIKAKSKTGKLYTLQPFSFTLE